MKQTKIILFTALSLFFLLNGCSSKNTELPREEKEIEIKNSSHNWYYFSNDGFTKIDKPQNAPIKIAQPWTETVRISSANSTTNGEKAFAVVNRLGILCFSGNNITLAPDNNIFNDRTAGNLVFLNDIPVFSVYKSAFFNNTITTPSYTNDKAAHLFLIQFDPVAKISYPLINTNSLTNEDNSEVTDFIWDNENWFCGIKTINNSRNSFSYIKWQPQAPLLSISPANAKDKIITEEISCENFRDKKAQLDYSKSPKRIQDLLRGFSKDLPFTLEIKNAGGPSPREYVNKIENSNQKDLLGKGIIADSWSAVLFEDGTLFMEGALPGKHILREGKPVAIRLPKLPAGFIYSDFTISGTTLYAAWEESCFYKTGRSGFIQIDLDETLYSKII